MVAVALALATFLALLCAVRAQGLSDEAVSVAKLNEYRFVVGLLTRTSSGGYVQCAGSLVTAELVLTAGHCLPPDFKFVHVLLQPWPELADFAQEMWSSTVRRVLPGAAPGPELAVVVLPRAPLAPRKGPGLLGRVVREEPGRTFTGSLCYLPAWANSVTQRLAPLRRSLFQVVANTMCGDLAPLDSFMCVFGSGARLPWHAGAPLLFRDTDGAHTIIGVFIRVVGPACELDCPRAPAAVIARVGAYMDILNLTRITKVISPASRHGASSRLYAAPTVPYPAGSNSNSLRPYSGAGPYASPYVGPLGPYPIPPSQLGSYSGAAIRHAATSTTPASRDRQKANALS